MWVLKKLVVHFGLKSFAERTLTSWWMVLEKFGREREEALLPGPIKGLAQFLLRIDTKVISLTHLQVRLVLLVWLLFLFPLSLFSHTFFWGHRFSVTLSYNVLIKHCQLPPGLPVP